MLGAPGSGKTLLLVESVARLLSEPGWTEAEILTLAPTRASAARLRAQIEQRLDAPFGGTAARTATSFAFGLLREWAARRGESPPRLLTGTVHDDVVAAAVEARLDGTVVGDDRVLPFAPEVMRSDAFRAELRELSSVIDDFATTPAELRFRLDAAMTAGARDMHGVAPPAELADMWGAAFGLLDQIEARLRAERAGEHSHSALLRTAARVLREDGTVRVPRLVLFDDAQEVSEGQLGLLMALADRGAAIWAFGDPDIATGSFQGERSRLLAGIEAERVRRRASVPEADHQGHSTLRAEEQLVVLQVVHRHGPVICDFVGELTGRVGTSGAGAQRGARGSGPAGTVEFSTVASASEQLGAIGHRLRRRHLGLDGAAPVAWSDMAVICRTQDEATRASRILAAHQVPTGLASGGVVLREHALVRELVRLLQHGLGLAPLKPAEVMELLGGAVGGLDPVALRRFRAALRADEDRAARKAGREPVSVDEVIWDGFSRPGDLPVIDSRGGRQLRRLARLARKGAGVRERGGTPRETLWAIWEGTGLADRLQSEALSARGSRSDEAHRELDAVMGLFFALERHEEQASDRPIAELLEELLTTNVAEDSLATRSERDVVTVTTPRGALGREFSTVCILGPQDGVWPNLRSRGLLLGAAPLERWLRGFEVTPPSRRDTLHDELRLFAQAASRARTELLAVAVLNDDAHPSSFYGLGRSHETREPLPSTRVTLRGAVAEMRRRLVADPEDEEALASLAALVDAEVPGAHPDDWYGVRPPSTMDPLVDLTEPSQLVRVSPSHIEQAETCPLDWAISKLGGGTTSTATGLGTLFHSALETVTDGSAEELMRVVDAHWESLTFDAPWQERQQHEVAMSMAQSLSRYLSAFAASDRELLGSEVPFTLRIGQAELHGTADRLESRSDDSGHRRVSVVDLKTGKTAPSQADRETHAQLQAYQLGAIEGAFAGDGEGGQSSDGARLLFVHPKTLRARGPGYTEAAQAPLNEEAVARFRERVSAVASIMAAGNFTAYVEHHCDKEFALGTACRIHIVPAVSHA